jgi:hypothetical protein
MKLHPYELLQRTPPRGSASEPKLTLPKFLNKMLCNHQEEDNEGKKNVYFSIVYMTRF